MHCLGEKCKGEETDKKPAKRARRRPNVEDTEWNRMYELWNEYKEETKTTNIKSNGVYKNQPLAKWVHEQ